MKSLVIAVCTSLAAALIGPGCTNGDGGTATMPSTPFGTEPVITGNESPGSGRVDIVGSLEDLCGAVCGRFQSVCPGSEGGPTCVQGCVSSVSNFPGCEQVFTRYLECLVDAPLSCYAGQLQLNGCTAEISAVNACIGGGLAAGTP